MTGDEYVRNVGWRLRDLPWSTRRDLLRELRAHLDELPADTDFRAQLELPKPTPATCAWPRASSDVAAWSHSCALAGRGT